MFANPTVLSSCAREFTPQGTTSPKFMQQKQQQQCYQAHGSYSGYSGQQQMQHTGTNAFYMGNGYAYGYYNNVPAGNSFASTAVGINLDDFSDLSDSDSDSDREQPPTKSAECEVEKKEAFAAPRAIDTTRQEQDMEPAEEPSPCAMDSQSVPSEESADESSGEPRGDEETNMSSASSEPEQEEVETSSADECAETPEPAGPVFNLKQMLQWREWALKHQEPQILYTTKTFEEEKPEPWRAPKAAAPTPSSRRTPGKVTLEVSELSWAAQQRRRKQSEQTSESGQQVARTIKSILNKLTLERFSSLCQQLMACGISASKDVEVLIHEVFEKATTQHHFIDMYADLCVLLHEHFAAKPFEGAGAMKGGRKLTFKRLLLDECQSSFERLLSPPEGLANLPAEERTAAEVGYKTHMLGNIKLVGALLSRGMLASKVGIAILEELLSNPTPEALESTAALLTVLGPTADRKEWPQYTALAAIFDQISTIVTAKKSQPRERFLLKDLLDLRRAGWVDKRPKKIERAMTLAQVADHAAGRRVETPSIRKVTLVEPPGAAPAAAAFDQEQFREGARKALVELRFSSCHSEASDRLRALGVPPVAGQAAEVAELVTHAVQEATEVERQQALKVIVEMAGSTPWASSALAKGLALFVQEVAPDLRFDVPDLDRILSEELGSTLTKSDKYTDALAALKSCQVAAA